MKKLFMTLASLTVMLMTAALFAVTASASQYGVLEYSVHNGEVWIDDCRDEEADYVVIPDQIDGYYVTVIGKEAFLGCEKLCLVELPGRLKEINDNAFTGCTALSSISLPNSLTKLGYGAFDGCYALSEVVMGNNLSTIESRAFAGTAIQQISLSEACTGFSTGRSHFSGCEDLYEVYLRGSYSELSQTFTSSVRLIFPDRKTRDASKTKFDYVKEVSALEDTHCKITFDVNGGIGSGGTVYTLSGQKVPKFETPEKNGCIFTGWYESKTGSGRAWDFAVDRAYGDKVLYAGWESVNNSSKFTVKFDGNKGTVVGSNIQTVIKGSIIGEFPTANREDYRFEGWFTAPEGGEEWTSFDYVDRNMTLYAHWTPTIVRITYDYNGSGRASEEVRQTPNAFFIEKFASRSGYEFLGWYNRPTGGTKVTSKNTIPESMTVYAHWGNPNCTVKLFKDKTSTSASKVLTVAEGKTLGTIPSVKKTGYKLVGWFDADGKQYTASSVISGDTTLYGKWEKLSYTVKFKTTKGTVSEASRSVEYGEKLGKLPVPVREGYNFAGWYTKSGCKGTKYTSTTKMPAKNVTLYAGWKKPSAAKSITLDKKSLSLTKGKTYTLTYTTEPTYITGKVTWKSSDTSVCAVSSKGVITAKKAGTATITVTTSNGKKSTVKVTVKAN